jgi:serine/threonine-protein kinase
MQGDLEKVAGVREGQMLADKYRIERLLGAGGMGAVVAAHHMKLDEKVAIKFLTSEARGNPDAVARFLREARAAVKIKSEHVARVIDVGNLDDGAPYMVMEYLEGGDLAAWLAQRGPLRVAQAVEFVLQACEAIAEAHVLGIVHRDLKPSNLFCIRRRDGLLSIKVLDFGISKVTGRAATGSSVGMMKTSSPIGSPHYMSPEQMESSKTVDARADIWALGVILFELLTGRVPFQGSAITDVVAKIMTARAPSLRDLRPDVPVGLERVITRCLEKDPARRYASVDALAVAIGEFGPSSAWASVERVSRVMQEAGVSSPGEAASPPSSGMKRVSSSATVATWGRTGAWVRSRVRLRHAGAAGTALLGTIVAVVLLREPRNVGQPPESATTKSSPAPSQAPIVSQLPQPAVTLAPVMLIDAGDDMVRPVPMVSTAPSRRGTAPSPTTAKPPAIPATPRKPDAYDHM